MLMDIIKFIKENLKTLVSFLLLISGAGGIWLIDLGNLSQVQNFELNNGFFSISGIKAFHIGMYLSIFSILSLSLMSILSSRK